MLFGVERVVTAPVNWGYEQVIGVGRTVLYHAGRSGALDVLTRDFRKQAIEQIEEDLGCFALGKANDAEEVAAQELNAVLKFAKAHAPKSYMQRCAIKLAAEPEPFALKQLDKIMEDTLPDPSPEPPRQASKQQ